MLKTYRARLIFYFLLLMVFLGTALALSYGYARQVILDEADNSLTTTGSLLSGNMALQEDQLRHYAEVISSHPLIQEYLFMVTGVGAEPAALEKLYQRNFAELPVDRAIFFDSEGRPLGEASPQSLQQQIREFSRHSADNLFFRLTDDGLELIAWSDIQYQNETVGRIMLTVTLDRDWIAQHRFLGGGYLFIEKNHIVQSSSLEQFRGKAFLPRDQRVVIDGVLYHVRPISLAGEGQSLTHLWYGISEQTLLDKLNHYSRMITQLAIAGALVILLMGLTIVRGFNRPLKQLTQITEAVAQGDLPKLDKSAQSNEIATLVNRFSEMLQALREKQQEVDRVHQQLKESALTDSLTGLYNRRHLSEVFPKLLSEANRDHQYLSGILLDLDHFKPINDEYGHPVGDLCLHHIAGILKDTSRASDYVFRIGGEEFLVLSLHRNPDSGEHLASKIRKTLERNACIFGDTAIALTTSIGISQADPLRPPTEALSQMLQQADQALYRAKAEGRNRVRVYQPPNTPPGRTLKLVNKTPYPCPKPNNEPADTRNS